MTNLVVVLTFIIQNENDSFNVYYFRSLTACVLYVQSLNLICNYDSLTINCYDWPNFDTTQFTDVTL